MSSTGTRVPWRWAIIAAAAVLAAGLWVGFRAYVVPASRSARDSLADSASSRIHPEDRRLPSANATPSPGAEPAVPEVSIAERVAPLMEDWRNAIIRKDAETVTTVDRAFADHPREFLSALMASAENDPEERVRSFSTRVLGKLRVPETTELLRKLLADRSEYVRFNAAWALGQLADRSAVARLRRMQQHDPSPSVRQSAGESLRAMEGG